MSILSELSSTLQISIKDSVFDMFNKINKVKDIFLKKDDPEILPTIKKTGSAKGEGYASQPLSMKDSLTDIYNAIFNIDKTPDVAEKTFKEIATKDGKNATTVEIVKATFIKIVSTLFKYGSALFIIMFYFYLASLVANDMIIYAAPIRAFFFVFTLFFTVTLFPCAIVVALYYLLKKGYDYYNQNLSSATVKPPLSFPMIFAILPLTTYYPTSPFARFFLWAFMYQKSDKPERMEKENERLKTIMENYRNDLHSSFEYLEKIKTTPPFSNLYEMIEKKLTIEGMHPIQKPKVEPIETSKVGEAKTVSLPPTISGKGSSLPATISGKGASLPPTISGKAATPQPATSQAATPEPATSLPAVIARPDTSQAATSQPATSQPATSLPAVIARPATSQAATPEPATI